MDVNAPPRENILILEDDASDCSSVERSLLEHFPGAGITTTSSVEEYRRLAAATDFDVVICSHELGGSNGIELIHELRLRDNDPAILVVSRSSDPHVVASIYNSGCHK